VVDRAAAFGVPGSLDTPTGGYVYDRHVIDGLRRLGWAIDVLDLGEGFPRPGTQALLDAGKRLATVRPGRPIVIDGLALGVLPEVAARLHGTNPLIALVHHPLALESGLSRDAAQVLHASEQMALASARRVVTTSPATKDLLVADYRVSADRISVVLPGTGGRPARRTLGGELPSLLAVGAVVPRKGYDVLVAALATLKDLPWRLTIAGDRGRDRAAAARLDADIAALGLEGRVSVTGAVADEHLDELYNNADIFVLPSRFEGYGMAFAEAIAHGLPVIGTAAGALPGTVPSGAGLLVPPDDVSALAGALRRLIEDPSERRRLSAAAEAAARHLPTWEDAARAFACVIEAVA
jgi:glycosyltransferase involved in cell wall biosynthesis